MTSHTVSVSISLDSKRVYAFVSRPENLPKWAPGLCRSLRKSRGGWLLETPDGEVAFRFVAKNKLGVLDHYLTLFRQPGMSARGFAKDIRLVERDLARLKRVMGR
ncbi:SRPBCC family protein [Candidatus Woesearchaeota archaeon]|nr:SRPBCC family protein [Candidatus Woesearchaeota archaeon]